MPRLVWTLPDGESTARWATDEGGGSQPTDEVIQFSEVATAGPAVAVVAVDLGENTVTVEGDLTGYAITDGNINIVGSTGNDGSYGLLDVSYDSGSDRTILTVDDPLSDGTVDGDVQFPARLEFSYELPADGAIEWVAVLFETQWEADSAYLWVGPDDEISGYVDLLNLSGADPSAAAGVQWPTVTLSDLTGDTTPTFIPTSALASPPSRHTYDFFPTGATINAFVLIQNGGTAGRTKVIIHHHFDEQKTPSIIPYTP
jgi:hypothetical protein